MPLVRYAFGNGCVQYLILHENQRASLSRVGQHSLCLFLYFKEKFVFVFQGKIRSLCYCEIEDLISPHPYSWSVQFQFESRRERLKNTSYLSILVHQRKFSTAGRGGLGLICMSYGLKRPKFDRLNNMTSLPLWAASILGDIHGVRRFRCIFLQQCITFTKMRTIEIVAINSIKITKFPCNQTNIFFLSV